MKCIKTNAFLWITGVSFTIVYVVLLLLRPQEAWCDEAFWTDWGRQIGINGAFVTNVWGGGKPSYSPMYAFLLAGVFRLVGFSYISAHLPNIFLSLFSFLLIGYQLNRDNIGNTAILLFGLLFWWVSIMYYIINCGRPEVLSLFLSIVVIQAFVRNKWLMVFIASLLLMCTSVQGVIAATTFIVIYFFLNIKQLSSIKHLILWHLGGYFFGLSLCALIMYKYHCLKAFFDTMFGFSKTLSSSYVWFRTFVKVKLLGKATEIVSLDSYQLSSPFSPNTLSFDSFISAYTKSSEYLVLLIILIMLLIAMKIKNENIEKMPLAMSLSALLLPLVFTLMGRYVEYYQWVSWVPLIVAFCYLFDQSGIKQQIKTSLFFVIVISILMFFTLTWKQSLVVDSAHAKDKFNMKEIAFAKIDPSEPTVIPYSWYYYVIESNENVFFQWSGFFPESLSKVIYNPTDDCNNPSFMKGCKYSRSLIIMEEWVKVK